MKVDSVIKIVGCEMITSGLGQPRFGRLIEPYYEGETLLKSLKENVRQAYGDDAADRFDPNLCAKVNLFNFKLSDTTMKRTMRKLNGASLWQKIRFIGSLKIDYARLVKRLRHESESNPDKHRAAYIFVDPARNFTATDMRTFLSGREVEARVFDKSDQILVQVRLPEQ